MLSVQCIAEIGINIASPWQIVIQNGASGVKPKLGTLDLLEQDASGAGSMFRVELAEPTRVVSVQLDGSGSEFTVRRPAGVASGVQLKGWGSGVVFDGKTAYSEARLQSLNYEGAARRYDLEVSGAGSMFSVTAG